MKFLDHLEEWLVTFLMGAATLIIFVAVVHRYAAGLAIPGVQDWLLSLSLSWAQELTIIMFVWMAKFGAAYGVRTGIHVGVDVLINRMQDKMRSKFIVFGLCAGALFTGIVATLGADFCLGQRRAPCLVQPVGFVRRRHTRRPHHAGPGVANLDGLQRRAAGHQPDVFPFFAGHGQFS